MFTGNKMVDTNTLSQQPQVNPNAKRALQIAMSVLDQVGEDMGLLEAVIRQLEAVLGKSPEGFKASSAPSSPPSSRGRDRRSRSRGKRSRSRGKNQAQTQQNAKPKPQAQTPTTGTRSSPGSQAAQPQQPQMEPIRVDPKDGTKRSTWNNRIRTGRQRALEALDQFKLKNNFRFAAVWCNAFWTLQEQWANFKLTPFFTDNKADPFRGLPPPEKVESLAQFLDDLGEVKRDIANHHFHLQDLKGDGQSLRGSELYKAYFPDVQE